MSKPRQVALTVASGVFAGQLDRTFTSFAQNPFLELHAFVVGDKLPEKRFPGITYHLAAPDPAFQDPMRDLYYRRLLFIDELDAEFALIVDNSDVLCLQRLPELPALLKGSIFAGCVEHAGGRYLAGQGYTSNYLNAGVTIWHVPSSRAARKAIVDRGRSRFRSVEDQLTLNEVLLTRFFNQITLLPSQYNYRAHLAPVRTRGWPTVRHLDGVMIYHNSNCVEAAKKLLPVKPRAELADLESDVRPLSVREKFWRKLRNRFQPHVVK